MASVRRALAATGVSDATRTRDARVAAERAAQKARARERRLKDWAAALPAPSDEDGASAFGKGPSGAVDIAAALDADTPRGGQGLYSGTLR